MKEIKAKKFRNWLFSGIFKTLIVCVFVFMYIATVYSQMYTYEKFTLWQLALQINKFSESNDVYEVMTQMSNPQLSDIILFYYDSVELHDYTRVRQIRKEKTEWANIPSAFEPSNGCSNSFNSQYSKSSFQDSSPGFVYSKEAGRKIPTFISEFPVSGFKIDAEFNLFETPNPIDSAISNLKSKNWIDNQSKAVFMEYNQLFKQSGLFTTLYLMIHIILNHWEIEYSFKHVTPFFLTSAQVILTLFTCISGILMLIFTLLDLKLDKDDYTVKLRVIREKILQKRRENSEEEFPSSHGLLVPHGLVDESKENAEDINEHQKNRDQQDEVKISSWRKFWARFRKPDFFEIVEIISINMVFLIQILKIIHYNEWKGIKYEEEKFYEIGPLEDFQYAILTLDFFLIVLMSILIFKYSANWIPTVTKSKTIFNQYIVKWAFFVSMMLLVLTAGFGFFLQTSIGPYLNGFGNYFVSLITSIKLFTKGNLFDIFTIKWLEVTSEQAISTFGTFRLLLIIIIFHIATKLILISLSWSAFNEEQLEYKYKNNRSTKSR